LVRYDQQTYAASYYILTLSPFAVQPYSWNVPPEETNLNLRWDALGIRVLTSRYGYPLTDIRLRNMFTNQSSLVFSDSSATTLDWSADGMKIAVARLGYLHQTNGYYDIVEQSVYSVHATTLIASPVARAYSRTYYGIGGPAAFSPSGASIALVFRSKIFLTDVP
jgi:Tol biopolymer transport system component